MKQDKLDKTNQESSIKRKCEDLWFEKMSKYIDELSTEDNSPHAILFNITNVFVRGWSGEASPTLHLKEKIRSAVYDKKGININGDENTENLYLKRLADIVLENAKKYAIIHRGMSSREWEDEINGIIQNLPDIVDKDNNKTEQDSRQLETDEFSKYVTYENVINHLARHESQEEILRAMLEALLPKSLHDKMFTDIRTKRRELNHAAHEHDVKTKNNFYGPFTNNGTLSGNVNNK